MSYYRKTIRVPLCPNHNKILDTIYPDNDSRRFSFVCGCIYMKDGTIRQKYD